MIYNDLIQILVIDSILCFVPIGLGLWYLYYKWNIEIQDDYV
jgi:hypothetical protein